MIRLHSKHTDTVTPAELVSMIRQGSVAANERLATAYFAEVHNATVQTVYINGGRKRVCVVDFGILEEEYKSWKDAILAN